MTDDWRLRIDVRDARRAFDLTRALDAAELEHDIRSNFAERVVVSRDSQEIFCYTGTREQAERVSDWVSAHARAEGWPVEQELRRWHPAAEEWKDAEQPLPGSAAEREAEREQLIEREREEAEQSGAPDFEVRVECHSHSDAQALSERLAEEGLPHVRRWHYVVIGASDEDAARAMAERVRRESPPGAIVQTEGTEHMVWASRPLNPFAIFGGLGG